MGQCAVFSLQAIESDTSVLVHTTKTSRNNFNLIRYMGLYCINPNLQIYCNLKLIECLMWLTKQPIRQGINVNSLSSSVLNNGVGAHGNDLAVASNIALYCDNLGHHCKKTRTRNVSTVGSSFALQIS